MNSLGDAWVDIHGDADPFARDAERGVREGAREAEDEAAEAGEDLGEVLSESMGRRLREAGPDLAREVERGLSRQKIRTKVTAQLDKEGNVIRQWVTTITDEISDAFDSAEGRTGIFSKIRMAIADAIGAGFNISGRSPLIGLLIPVFGALAALILAAVQALNGLVALLTIIPGLLAAIGLQVGVLFIAFNGMGDAIQGAFAAKNAKELHEALKDLTPAAQNFVHNILPLKEVFGSLSKLVQENFFVGLGNLFGTNGPLQPLIGTLGGLGRIATSLGEAFNMIAKALGGREMVMFINELVPSTVQFIDKLGPALNQFITGLAKFAGSPAIMKFMDQFGTWVVTIISKFGAFLFDLASSEGFADWLERMTLTLESVGSFIMQAVATVGTLLYQLDQAGGREFIDGLTEALLTLQTFLASDVGKKGLENLLTLTLFLFQVTVGLIAVFLTLLAGIEFVGEAISAFLAWVWSGVNWLWDKVVGFFTGAEDEITAALGNVDNFLFDAGKRIIQGMLNGIRAMVPNIRTTLSGVMAVIRSFWPFSPAKEGPLSGAGDPMIAGKNIVDRLSAGITAGSQDLGSVMNQSTSNIVFGANAIQVGFNGALPTQQQAMQTGAAVGQGALSILARNTRLAVRTM
jgi:hypothetical protein